MGNDINPVGLGPAQGLEGTLQTQQNKDVIDLRAYLEICWKTPPTYFTEYGEDTDSFLRTHGDGFYFDPQFTWRPPELSGKYLYKGKAYSLSALEDCTIIGDKIKLNDKLVLLSEIPDGTRLPNGNYVINGKVFTFFEMVYEYRMDGVGKANDKFMEYYDKVKQRNEWISLLNTYMEQLRAIDPDKEGRNGWIGDHGNQWGHDKDGNYVEKDFEGWLRELGLGDAIKDGRMEVRGNWLNWWKGALEEFKESINAKIKELNSENEMDMIFLNQSNNDKQTTLQMLSSDLQKWAEELRKMAP